jgi:hypothetical protein
MRKLACAVCVCVLTLAFGQWELAGQRRVGPPSAATESLRSTTVQGASYKPAIEYQYLMELYFRPPV